VVAVLAIAISCGQPAGVPRAPGDAPTGDWLGQEPPGDEARVFAPRIVSTGAFDRDLTITPDGDEIYTTVMLPDFTFSAILVARRVDGVWSAPEVAPFSGRYRDLEPTVSPDGRRLFFASFRPDDGEGPPEEEPDIWVVDRGETGWGPPRPLGPPVNSEGEEYFPSVTRDGTLYFTRRTTDGDEAIYRAELRDGAYLEPERLGPEVNAGKARFNAWVAPDESLLIVPIFGLPDSLGATDYYVCFRREDGGFTEPVHLDDRVNSPSRHEYSASLSPDGRYLFFMSSRGSVENPRFDPAVTADGLKRLLDGPENGNPDIYWIDASFLHDLQPVD